MIHYLDTRLQESSHSSFRLHTPLPCESLAFYLAQSKKLKKPQVVVTENMEKAKEFMAHYGFWTDQLPFLLPDYDPHLWAGVQIRYGQIHQRLSWLFQALNNPEASVFVAPITALLQKTLPPEAFWDQCIQFSLGDEWPPDIFNRLHGMGYVASPLVEDAGQFSNRGGLVDIFSPQMKDPIRIELFGTEIESLRCFDSTSQRTIKEVDQFTLIPAREVLLDSQNSLSASQNFLKLQNPELHVIANHLRLKQYCENLEYHLPLFHPKAVSPFNFFQTPPRVWLMEPLNIETSWGSHKAQIESSFKPNEFPLHPEKIYCSFNELEKSFNHKVSIEGVNIIDSSKTLDQAPSQIPSKMIPKPRDKKFNQKIRCLLEQIQELPFHKVVSIRGKPQFDRMKVFFESKGFQPILHEDMDYNWDDLFNGQDFNQVHFFPRKLPNSFILSSEKICVFSLEHFLGKSFQDSERKEATKRGKHLSFGELNENDYIIHILHGVGEFKGLVKMPVAGVEAEFLKIEFRDKDKLFLPIYRIHQIHKYTAEKFKPTLDKLGGSRFAHIKTKSKRRLREMAHDLIKLYAQRSQCKRSPYQIQLEDITDFFNAFPYQETEDQIMAIEDIMKDMASEKPMDRLICGDVGFGKTEVAMRAAFVAAANQKQVAVLAPTTVLTLQHLATFEKRFKDWPLRIEIINRLKTTSEVKKILEATKQGKVDILIGTHRLLSQDVAFKDLGLLVIDEEQKFGVKQKEKIRKMKVNTDTISLSATPIPRTLNMSLLKIRDLSLINTAPMDRLEIRTFICRFNKEIIKRAIETELQRGGQVFFLHNRVQSIYSLAEELRELLPGVTIGVGHGQLKEKELEAIMLSFFNNEIKVLIASTIIESGVDIPNANTLFINQADQFGLSQLYQLRGRVGRSSRRAYCYLLTEPHKTLSEVAKHRLNLIHQNTALGSGMQIAQYDFELRGAGTLLGEEQSGLMDNLGYEFYMQLLEEAIQEAKGEEVRETIEPEINLKMRAFIPNNYIPNIRLRLSYYRALTQIEAATDIDDFEEELKDQFGQPPEEVTNLLGLMLIRHQCLKLGIKDLSSGKDTLVLSLTDQTPLSGSKIVPLVKQTNRKYSIQPDNRLKIRMKEMSWPRVYEELQQLF